ncbi:sperm flagellar protein 1-like isoform X2 [Euwallacea similis]|uniref:sperm flagellar protein 1-like isoform X2 n=1 Tax=Euwallacea similis TaxID=1736056 RepID=UPI00344B1B39
MNLPLEDIFQWVDEHEITRQKKNFHRDFSDAVSLAEILKKHYPKLVELHNYAPKHALSQKIVNWETLNKKVLNKLKINLSPAEQGQLARAVPGVIERLLHKIKLKVEKHETAQKNVENKEKTYYLEGISPKEFEEGKAILGRNDDNAGVNALTVLDIEVKTEASNEKLIPSNICDQMKADTTEKINEIAQLRQKVEQMEKLLKIQDKRITDLTKQLHVILTGEGDNVTSPRTRLFNKIF